MKRAIRLLAIGLVLGTAGGVAHAAFSSQATNPNNSIVAHADWTAPPITESMAIKSTGGVPNFVRPLGSYRLCAEVGADSGNPASGLLDVVTDLTGLGGLLGQVLSLGTSTQCRANHNYNSGARTVPALTPGQFTVTTTSRDNGGNVDTDAIQVTIDNTRPDPVDVDTTNGGTLNKPDNGDQILFSFDEPIDPDSVIDGWNGVGTRTITVTGTTAGGGNDRLAFSVPIVASGNYLTIKNDYITGTVTWANSTIEAVGTVTGQQYRVTLGGMSDPTDTRVRWGTTAMTWATTTSLWDRAGNTLPAQTFTEPAPNDSEF